MFKVKKKNLILVSGICLFVLLVCLLVPSLRTPFLSILKLPLKLSTLIQQEFRAMIFYHSNFVQSAKLRKENDFLNSKLNAEQEIILENERLKKLLSFKDNAPYKLIAAKVIARSPDSWTSSLIIDKGTSSGIKRGMVVVNYLGLVGKVAQTQSSTSRVSLLSDPSLSVSAIVQRSRQEGLISGTLGSYLIMKYLPEDADINLNDTIISSGLNDVYPKGLPIGTVVEIGKEYSGLSRYAIVKPAVNLSDIEEVLIIIL